MKSPWRSISGTISAVAVSGAGVQRSGGCRACSSRITCEASAWRCTRWRDSQGWPNSRYSGSPSSGTKPTSSSQLRAAPGVVRLGIQNSAASRISQSSINNHEPSSHSNSIASPVGRGPHSAMGCCAAGVTGVAVNAGHRRAG